MKTKLIIVANDIRSAHNVGSLLRTADGLGVNSVILAGYTPYPKNKIETRLPYIAEKLDKQISKTALGAEKTDIWNYQPDILEVIRQLKAEGYTIIALEQTPSSILLNEFTPPDKIALIIGNEIDGVDKNILYLVDASIEIPMNGKKESYNVAIATAMAAYHILYSRA